MNQSESAVAEHGMVCSVDALASRAGVDILRRGGNAVDAAIATSAVLTVTTQHMCGLGGDLFALVSQDGAVPLTLNASGHAGSGADAARLRAEGHPRMPMLHDIRAVPVPGCVDGWLALHTRLGRLPLDQVLAHAIGAAEEGFAASPLLAATLQRFAGQPGMAQFGTPHPGELVRRPAVGRALRAIAAGGRDAFYLGEFGQGLHALGAGEYDWSDLERVQADWVTPLSLPAFGKVLHTVPPNSSGYLTLAGAWIADRMGLPADPSEGLWAHLTVEAARFASYDRLDVLHESADGAGLLDLDRLAARVAGITPDQAAVLGDRYQGGGTIALTVIDEDRMGVSFIQSNAAGFGSMLVEPATGIFLQNRGLGFSLVEGHPAEYAPGRRPPHTLAPALVTSPDLRLDCVLATMGGDTQPQILLQLLARMAAGQTADQAVHAPRWALEDPDGGGFDTWEGRGQVVVALEADAPADWQAGLTSRGHVVRTRDRGHGFGHAHAIRVIGDGLEGGSDPRALSGAAIGY